MEKITFCPEDGEAVEFFVLEQTRLGGVDYILVTDSEDDDAEALILKDVSAPEDEEAIYSIVDDDKEMDAVAAIFTDMLEDIELEGINASTFFVQHNVIYPCYKNKKGGNFA